MRTAEIIKELCYDNMTALCFFATWSHRLFLICWYLHIYCVCFSLTLPVRLIPPCLRDILCQIKMKSHLWTQAFLHLFTSEPLSNISTHTASCLPVSNQLDSRAASPEDMQSLSLYKASTALTSIQVLSCSMWKASSMMLWLEHLRPCNFF